MFRRKQPHAIDVRRLSSLIAEGVHIVGDVHVHDGLRVDGHVEGSIVGEEVARAGQDPREDGGHGLLVLSGKGMVTGTVRVRDAVINGTIRGDIHVEDFLELQPDARVTGNISYRRLQMACGATVEGRLERLGETGAAAPTGAAAEAPPGPASKVVSLPRTAALSGTDDR